MQRNFELGQKTCAYLFFTRPTRWQSSIMHQHTFFWGMGMLRNGPGFVRSPLPSFPSILFILSATRLFFPHSKLPYSVGSHDAARFSTLRFLLPRLAFLSKRRLTSYFFFICRVSFFALVVRTGLLKNQVNKQGYMFTPIWVFFFVLSKFHDFRGFFSPYFSPFQKVSQEMPRWVQSR